MSSLFLNHLIKKYILYFGNVINKCYLYLCDYQTKIKGFLF